MIVGTGESDAAVMLQEQIDAMSPEEWAAMNKRVAARIVSSARRLNRPVPPDMLEIDETPIEKLIERRRSAIADRDAVPPGDSKPSNFERSTSYVSMQSDVGISPLDVPPALAVSSVWRDMPSNGVLDQLLTTGVIQKAAKPVSDDRSFADWLSAREQQLTFLVLTPHKLTPGKAVPGVSTEAVKRIVTEYLGRAQSPSSD